MSLMKESRGQHQDALDGSAARCRKGSSRYAEEDCILLFIAISWYWPSGRSGRRNVVEDLVTRLVRYERGEEPRQPGALRGRIKIAPGFDELPADLARAFGMAAQ